MILVFGPLLCNCFRMSDRKYQLLARDSRKRLLDEQSEEIASRFRRAFPVFERLTATLQVHNQSVVVQLFLTNRIELYAFSFKIWHLMTAVYLC